MMPAGPMPGLATPADDARSIERDVHRRLVDLPLETLAPEARRAVVADVVRELDPLVGGAALADRVERVLARIDGFGPLQLLLDQPDISEIMINGPGPVWVERGGCVEASGVALDLDTIVHLIERIAAPRGQRADPTSPLLDARLADGSRVNVIVAPVAIDGPCITIRRFGVSRVPLDRVASRGVAALLRWAVGARLNVIVSGGTGAGKTTLLNELAASIPTDERIITIEDTAELQLGAPHVVRLEARQPTAEGLGQVTIRDLVRNALRMRPDRIVVGEVRGPEALDMVQAMNTGHEGSLSTCHANSPADAMRRLETMLLLAAVDLPLAAGRDQLVAAIDLVVQVARTGGGQRSVVAVGEVVDDEQRVVPIADQRGLRRLPARRPRNHDAPPPSTDWIDS